LERWDTRQAEFITTDAYFGNRCADAEYPGTLGAFSRVGDQARAASRFGPWAWWGFAACAAWPTAEDRYAGPWSVRTSDPVLLVGNRYDPATGYAGALGAAEVLRGSRLLTYAGWGHTAYGVSRCVTRHVNAYLVRGVLPAKGTVCPANENPFLHPSWLPIRPWSALVGTPPPRALAD
jgi:hypothetical protein